MSDFEASYLPFESLFKKFASDMTSQYTYFTSLSCHLMKFYIRAELLDTKLLALMLPKASRAKHECKKYNYGNFANLNL